MPNETTAQSSHNTSANNTARPYSYLPLPLKNWNACRDRYMIVATCLLVLGIAGMIAGMAIGLGMHGSDECQQTTVPTQEPPIHPTPPSMEGQYKYAAVASDHPLCSKIGADLMAREQASAVDVAIATLLCVGATHIQSSGIGGGHFMTIYNRTGQSVNVVMAREMAPAASDELMYTRADASSTEGGLSIGVPGEIKGFGEAWKLYGRVPWKSLFQPTIKLCREGHPVQEPLTEAIEKSRESLGRNQELRKLLTNPKTNELYRTGETMRCEKLARTLEIISEEGPDAFYSGELSRNITLDIGDAGGIITEADLANYEASIKEPYKIELTDGARVYVPPLPSSGVVYQLMLNILQGYSLNEDSISSPGEAVTTWHRIAETFKFAFSKRSVLGDSDAEDQEFKDNMAAFINNLTSPDFASHIRSKIWDNQTHDIPYYDPAFKLSTDAGTTHISVIAPNGDAVSCTSTVNLYFGSKVVGSRTGIIFNNEMDDFSTPNTTNYFGLPASPANFIKPRKRPLSSMTPAIVIDPKGDVKLITGGSGGTQILTAVLLNTIETLWFGMGIKESIDHWRIHHQLAPNSLFVENGFPEEYANKLREKGHVIKNVERAGSRVQGILLAENGLITANSDYRKFGAPDGY
ncbi:hypothetical protein ScPMuIL_006005 [Solemya velum]